MTVSLKGKPSHMTAAAWQHQQDKARGIKTPAQIRRDMDALEQRLQLEGRMVEGRSSVLEYTRCTYEDELDPDDWFASGYDAQRHHEAIAAALDEFERDDGSIQFLILTAPPRHGKSELCSRRLPAYASARRPRRNVIVAAYNDDFAADYGAEVRAIIQSKRHRALFPNHTLRRGGTAKDRLQTEDGGLLVFVGRGGSITGRGGDLIILDDLFKDADEARSPAIRDQVWNWFTKVIGTRMSSDRAKILIIMTRWHEDDLVGRLTDPENPHYVKRIASKFKIIEMPALARPPKDAKVDEQDRPIDSLGRLFDEPLWPSKFGREFLEDKRALDPLGFNALYQQSPSPEDGILFRREYEQWYERDDLPKKLRIYAASDHAVGTKQRNTETCLLIVGVDERDHVWLLDCWWQRAATDKVVAQMILMMKLHQPAIWWAESGHISASIGPFLRKRMREEGVWTRIDEVTADADKERRAESIAGRWSMGYVHLPKFLPWSSRALDQLLKFPGGRLVDFVDTIAHIGRGLDRMIGAAKMPSPVSRPAEGTLGFLKKQAAEADRAKRQLGAAWG